LPSFSQRISTLVVDQLANRLAEFLRNRARRLGRSTGIVVPIDDLIGIRIFSTGRFEQTQIDGILGYLDEKGLAGETAFVDVGANIGVYSMALSSRFSKTYAFEANPVTFKILEANVALSRCANTHCFNVALSDRREESFIYVPENGNLGWATLDPDHHDIPVRKIGVVCDTLDALLSADGRVPEEVRLIKIDVEGHELGVLKGARELIAVARPALLCEMLSRELGAPVYDLLKEYGYRHFSVFERAWSASTPFHMHVARRPIDMTQSNRHALVLAEF